MTVNLEFWHQQKLHSDIDYDAEVNQMETIEFFAEWLEQIETTGLPGDSVTIIIRKI